MQGVAAGRRSCGRRCPYLLSCFFLFLLYVHSVSRLQRQDPTLSPRFVWTRSGKASLVPGWEVSMLHHKLHATACCSMRCIHLSLRGGLHPRRFWHARHLLMAGSGWQKSCKNEPRFVEKRHALSLAEIPGVLNLPNLLLTDELQKLWLC